MNGVTCNILTQNEEHEYVKNYKFMGCILATDRQTEESPRGLLGPQ